MVSSGIPSLIVQKGLAHEQVFLIKAPSMVVGRMEPADIILDNKVVSRQHAQITQEGGQFYLEDLNSLNGTFVNGNPIKAKVPIRSGDRIDLGDQVSMVFEEGLRESNPAHLEVTISGSETNHYPLRSDGMTIGRSKDNDIVVSSGIVSRHHARLEFEDGKYFLVILPETTNVMFVNGQPGSGRILLHDRDEIRMEGKGNEPAVEIAVHLPSASKAGAPTFVQTLTGTTAESEVSAQPAPAGETMVESLSVLPSDYPEKAPSPGETMVESLTVLPSDHPGKPASPGATMIESLSVLQMGGEKEPAKLVVTIAGQSPMTFILDRERMTIGRSEENDIVIPSPLVSRNHAVIERSASGYELVVSSEATNVLTCQGRIVTGRSSLQHGDILRIDSREPGLMVSIAYQSPSETLTNLRAQAIQFGQKAKLTFGRDPTNDVVLDMPTISRYHAQVERVGKRYFVTDLQSANGTFVNNERIAKKTGLNPKDSLRIGSYRFLLGENQFVKYDDTSGLQVTALGLNKWVRKNLNILANISLVFQPREFIVVVGQSGGGKSTLVDAIAGYRPATHGKVIINGIDVYRNFDAIRNEIGFVPQRDIIHMELTVYQALDYAAQLRMPRDTSKAERHKRIIEVLDDLDLAHRKDNPISSLSGGQQKRVSIGVELITRPGLFFLDEPTSGLDPGTETAFMHLCRRLADQGRTIIMVTHATKNVMLADKVVFLARGGYLAWFGPPDEALAYFDQYRTERERRTSAMEFDQIYAILDDPSKGSAKEWAERFQGCPAYQKYIAEPLKLNQNGLPLAAQKQTDQERKRKKRLGAKVSSLRQFLVLSARNVKILTRDRSSMVLMVLIAPAVGLLDFVIAPLMGNKPFDWVEGDANNGIIAFFLLTLYCLLVGGLSQMREFVKETDIYKRERLVNLKIVPYVASKIWVAVLLALFHALAYTGLHLAAFTVPISGIEYLLLYATLFLAVLSGMISGLLASALSPAASSAPMIMIMIIIPQIVLSGVLSPVPTNISQIASIRWALEGVVGIAGVGSDVAADPCWKLDPEIKDIMTLDQKEQFGCRCLGLNVFKPGSCDFPAVGSYYEPEVNEAAPVEPAKLGAEPPRPEFPPRPEKPTDPTDQVAMVGFLNALDSYMKDVDRIQAEYESQIELYKAQADTYEAQMAKYQKDLVSYDIKRSGAVERAEGLIEGVSDQFGWIWVNKEDKDGFYAWLFKTWRAQLIIITVYIAVILFLIKRKDVR
jgi:pSer/pThr/pTyr-binding forkhead associated (FHA) protein/ABC-type multidrug transport system ATPase subunit